LRVFERDDAEVVEAEGSEHTMYILDNQLFKMSVDILFTKLFTNVATFVKLDN